MRQTAAVQIVLVVLGALIVLLTWGSVLSVLVVPRRSRDRIASLINRFVAAAFRLATARLRSYPRRDRVLAWQAALTLLLQLAIWLGLFYLGFALMLIAVRDGSVSNAFAQAGSSLFTLGYAGPDAAALSAIDYLAAASGLVVVALQIGYLPTLYGAFNRRETEVRLLASRAGTPAWGPEILARTRFGITDADDDGFVMDEFYLGWERWAADLSESHTNYPVLIHFRSPEKYASWVIALLAVLDSAALWLALSPATAPRQEARLLLRMGFSALRSIAPTLGLAVDEDPDPDAAIELTYAEFLEGVGRISSTTFRMDRTPEQAWPDFRGWRVNYEALAYAIAARTDAVPAAWSGPRRTGDAPMEPIRPPNRNPTRSVDWHPEGAGERADPLLPEHGGA